MKVVVQRCKKASVVVKNKEVGKIDYGMLILVCFTENDSEKEIDYLVNKILHLRIFDDENKVMNKNILEENGSILSVSQFTLYADTKKGNRPSYKKALNGKEAKILYNKFNEKLRSYIKVEEGIFGEEMEINLVGDGPITIILEKESEKNA